MIRRTACLVARNTDVYRNLAIEKHLMDTLPDATAVLYLWQNRHAVIAGRNQDPWKECAVGALLSDGGQIARRISGGGAVYQDMGNLNFSILVPKHEFDVSRQFSVIGMALGALGLQVKAARRNDLMLLGCKCSTSAFFKSGAAALHHGTLLVNSELKQMNRYLTVDEARLRQTGQFSPADRLINLSSAVKELSIHDVQSVMYHAFGHVYGSEPAMLDERMLDQRSIEALTEGFSDPQWIYPREEKYTTVFSERFPWGGVTVQLRIEGAVIRAACLHTDAMEAGLFPPMEQALIGAPCLISGICTRIDQKLASLRDPYLMQIAEDVKNMIRRQLRGR